MGKQHAANKKIIALDHGDIILNFSIISPCLDWLRLLFSVSGPTLVKVPESQVSFRSPESRVLLLGSQILGLRSWDGPRDSDLTFRVLGLWSRVLPLIRILGPGSRVPPGVPGLGFHFSDMPYWNWKPSVDVIWTPLCAFTCAICSLVDHFSLVNETRS